MMQACVRNFRSRLPRTGGESRTSIGIPPDRGRLPEVGESGSARRRQIPPRSTSGLPEVPVVLDGPRAYRSPDALRRQGRIPALAARASQAHHDLDTAAKECAKGLHHAQSDGTHNKALVVAACRRDPVGHRWQDRRRARGRIDIAAGPFLSAVDPVIEG